MKKIYYILLLQLTISLTYAQKEDYVWLFGQNKELSETDTAYRFDFNVRPFEISKAINKFGFDSQNASICDEEGNLLFYSTGCGIINKNAELMPNGDSLNYDYWYDKYWWTDCEIMGYPGVEDILILKDPAYDLGYYVLHKKIVYYQGTKDSMRLQYSYVDMNLDNGMGDVVHKNRVLWHRDNLMRSYLTAIQHENGKDWWVIQPLVDDSLYLTYLIDEDGISLQYQQNSHEYFTKYRSSSGGTARFSPDGIRYALYNYTDQLHIYDFDRQTGLLSNHQKVMVFDSIDYEDIRFCSVEWSPNSRFIYTASRDELHQIDTWEEDLHDGIRLIDIYNGTVDPFPTPFFLMALGPDCRIYMCATNGAYSYHVIHQPNKLGTACDFVQNGIKLPYPLASGRASMPNFPRFRVDEEEKCDPTIVSVFGEKVWYRRDLKVWPNPSSGMFNVELPKAVKGLLVVTDLNGQIVHDIEVRNFDDPIQRINISYLPNGRYNVEFWPAKTSYSAGDLESPAEYNRSRVYYGAQVVKVE